MKCKQSKKMTLYLVTKWYKNGDNPCKVFTKTGDVCVNSSHIVCVCVYICVYYCTFVVHKKRVHHNNNNGSTNI